MTATRRVTPGSPSRSHTCPTPDPALPQRSEGHALIEDLIAVAANLLQQRAIDRGHDEARALAGAVFGSELRVGEVVVRERPFRLERHEPLERLAAAPRERVFGRETEPRELVLGQVDPVALRVLADVADDVGELERNPERLGE